MGTLYRVRRALGVRRADKLGCSMKNSVSAKAWFVYAMITVGYVSAILQRTTFGVSGVQATTRFGINAQELSIFVVLQLAVYAVMQVPVGVLLDRYGTRVMLTVGSVVMALGQFVVGITGSFELAVVARGIVGAGDAMMFISALRVIPVWFPAREVPLVAQVFSLLGQGGQVLSAVPFLALLHLEGWRTAFLLTAAIALGAGILCLMFVRDAPPGERRARISISPPDVWRSIKVTWLNPGTRLAMWTHWVTMFTSAVFAYLWGVPYMEQGLGFSSATASLMLTILSVLGAVAGPVLGATTARLPQHRVRVVLIVVLTAMAAWVLVICWPGIPPQGVVVALMVTLAFAGPGSLIGFEFSRVYNPVAMQGIASGMTNIGGYTATLLSMWLIGFVLDVQHQMNPSLPLYNLGAFRVAFCVLLLVCGIGMLGMWRCLVLVRRQAE